MADIFCGVDDSVFTQKECGIDLGGIIHVAFIDKSVASPSQANLEDQSWWNALGATSPPQVFIIQDTRGEYNGGTPVETDGFGESGTQVNGYEHEVSFESRGMQNNRAFWEDKMRRKYKFAFWTAGDDIYYIDIPVSVHATPVIPKNNIEESYWQVTIKWKGSNG